MKMEGGGLRLSASDLVGFLNCRHLTTLDHLVATGELAKPHVWDPMLEVLRERGFRHETAYLEHLARQGLDLVTIGDGDLSAEAAAETRAVMERGASVIVQGVLRSGQWAGRADVLLRVERPSELGSWSYEVVDTKLARETKAGTILQLSLYSDLLRQAQGRAPDFMHVVAPWREFAPETWRVNDFSAFFRRVARQLEAATKPGQTAETYPEPNAHCDVCRWAGACEERRRGDDHLSFVAGISKSQITELASHGISTMADLAGLEVPLQWSPERGSAGTYERVAEQARLQVEARLTGERQLRVLPVEAELGLCRLPEPSAGDIFLDFEGDPFVGEHGLEYLTGYWFEDDQGDWQYRSGWALDRQAEKAAFEQFIDFVMERWARHPGMHVYHYGGYESGALKRLMGRYATREDELDRLLRGGRLVDLLGVVRHSVRASVESYSIKKLEPFYGYERDVALPDANVALRRIETALELGEIELGPADQQIVERYNRDDCISTQRLRDWLEGQRAQLVAHGTKVPRPQDGEGEPGDNLAGWLARIAPLVEKLTDGVPVDEALRRPEQHARWLLAQLLGWHRREAKASWWEYFRLAELPASDLFDERGALSGLEFVARDGGTDKCPIHLYRFPFQDSDVAEGDPLRMAGGADCGSVVSLDRETRTLGVKKRQTAADVHPDAVFVHEHVSTQPLQDSLIRLAEHVVACGFEDSGAYQTAVNLLLRRAPLGEATGELRQSGESALEAALRVSADLEGSVLSIQGPPGAGKTFTGAQMICELVRQGKKVGIVANSHAVIRNLLDCVIKAAGERGLDLRCVQKPKDSEPSTDRLRMARNAADVFNALKLDCAVAAGTAWLWSTPAAAGSVDVLFVDEAAQMALANVVAVAPAGRALVLLGDPQQLDQPMQGTHPDGTGCSALEHLLHGRATIADNEGLFLDQTWRLHPDICRFTSEVFYEGKLHSKTGLEHQSVWASNFPSSGLGIAPVPHSGNQNCSPEEADYVSGLVRELLGQHATWTNADATAAPLGLRDVLIITPYNAQVLELSRRLPGARIGTVDKFQGQEAPIAIYSLATSTHADAPRGMEFLYSLNRLNVATSRARALSVIVASPALFEAECHTPRQMQLANAFCRYLEVAAPM